MKNTLDFLKLDNGQLGAINFNNMIPVKKNNYKIIDFKQEQKLDDKYRVLLMKQLSWLNKNYIQVINKSSKLYNMYINDKLSENIKERCCNFQLLKKMFRI